MSTKGNELTIESKYQISKSKQSNRTKVIEKLKEYTELLYDLSESGLIPSIVSASLFAGISKKALLQWELTTGENSEVRELLDFIRDVEEKYLREGGLLGITHSTLTIKLLEVDHGLISHPQNLIQNNTYNVSPELLAEAIELSRSIKKGKP